MSGTSRREGDGEDGPKGRHRCTFDSLADLRTLEGAFSGEEAADETDDLRDPERVIGGYKSQVTTLQHRLDAAKHFLLREFGIDIGDIDNDGQLVVGSASEANLERFKAQAQASHDEALRLKHCVETLQGDLQYVFGDEVSFQDNGHILWSEATQMILRVHRTGQEAQARIRGITYEDRPINPPRETGLLTQRKSFTKRTFGFELGRKPQPSKEG